jgi:hypothetical protein
VWFAGAKIFKLVETPNNQRLGKNCQRHSLTRANRLLFFGSQPEKELNIIFI